MLSIGVILFLINRLSYILLKAQIFGRRKWDLNICCGKMDGGGVNADIVKHRDDIPNFRLIDDIYHLPFKNRQFKQRIVA